ncbi:hypothetical protein TNCV_3305151 [Trichonephila clavipes]|nr:hypothetical protein TNCV_3305151 [Trichonephila clavipes]
MAASSSSFIPTPLAHADTLGEGHPRWNLGEGHPRWNLGEGHPRWNLGEGHPRWNLGEGHPRQSGNIQSRPKLIHTVAPSGSYNGSTSLGIELNWARMTGNGKLFHGVNFLGRNGWKMVLQHLMTRSFHWVRDPENVLARVTVELFRVKVGENTTGNMWPCVFMVKDNILDASKVGHSHWS